MTEQTTELTKANPTALIKADAPIENPTTVFRDSIYSDMKTFDEAQRMAKSLSLSTIVPTIYQNNLPNCMIAIEVSWRIKTSPIFVMQNLYIVHGKPSWASQWYISGVNTCGKFRQNLQFDFKGVGDTRSCAAWTITKAGERIEGVRVSIDMAKKEGWFGKAGSKWQTIPELMLTYRAATFFARAYCPEISLGFISQDEVIDIEATSATSQPLENPALKAITAKSGDLAI